MSLDQSKRSGFLAFGFVGEAPMTALALTFALSILIGACDRQAAPSNLQAHDLVLRRGLLGEPASLDPADATDSYSTEVLQDLYEGLTSETSTGEVVPGVASSWQIDSSGTRYTFNLRSNARWSNGQRVRAQDFVAAWQRVLDPKQASPVSNDLRLIMGAPGIIAGRAPLTSLGVVAASDSVLVVDLEKPAPYFPQLLSHSAAFPVFSDASARSHDSRSWVSNGPYVLSAWQPGTRIELTRNLSYWDLPNTHIDRVEYQFAPDQNSQFAAYRAGQLDMTDTMPANAIFSFGREHPGELVIAPYLGTAFYELNLTKKPFASELGLRKALAMAIDRHRLVSALGSGQTPAYGLVPPGTWNYQMQHWDWDNASDIDRIAEARRLYKEAGYTTNKPLRLRLLFNSNPVIKQTAVIIAAMWREDLGVETELIDQEFRVFLQSRKDRKSWEVVRIAWTADYNDATSFLDVFRQNSANNDSGYSSAAFDELLDEAAAASDVGIRRPLLENAERVMLSDYPAIPLYFLVSKRLVKPYVSGVKLNPLNRIGSKVLNITSH